MASHPDILVRPGGDTALLWTTAVSALAHVTALGLLALAPQRFLDRPERVQSYTVDLIAPSAIGGTNLVPGPGRGGKPLVAPKPAPAAQRPAKAEAPVAIREQARQPAEPPAKPEAPKQPEPPKPAEAPKAEQAKPVEPPKAIEAPPPEKPAAQAVKRPAPEPAIAKKVEAAPPKPVAPAEAKKQPDKPAPNATGKGKVTKPTQPAPNAAATDRDQRIAAAIRRRAQQLNAGESAKAENPIDRQIAAAIQNRMIAAAVQQRAEQLARAGGDGSPNIIPGPGGAIGYGPGTGPGGTAVGAEYILYFSHMIERIKASWAWAGASGSLKAKVQFNITPAGDIVNVRIVEPSGDPSYDASVERAVRAANPLNPPPEKYRSEFGLVELTFEPEDLRS